MCPLRSTYDPRALSCPYLLKVIRFRLGSDFWNSFAAAMTRSRDATVPNPLGYLRVRAEPRREGTEETSGMLYTPPAAPGAEPTYTLAIRKLVPTPDPILRLKQPVSHETPMYTPDQKAGYSSPLSTTCVSPKDNITPKLFSGSSDYFADPMCGVGFPLEPSESYVLLNRVLAYDEGTVFRPYDTIRPYPHALLLTTLLTEERFKGENARYSEIMARVRFCNRERDEDPSLAYMKPFLFVCHNLHKNILLLNVLITLKRVFDLKFCLKRKFNVPLTQPTPIVLYVNDAKPASQCFCGPLMFAGTENIDRVIREFLEVDIPMDEKARRLYNEIKFTQGLLNAMSRDAAAPLESTRDFDGFLRAEPLPNITSHVKIFYMETLRAVVEFFNARPEVREFHLYFQDKIQKYMTGTEEEKHFRFERYGFNADFEQSRFPQRNKFHPLHDFRFGPNHITDGELPLVQAVKKNDREKFDELLANPDIKVNKREPGEENAPALNWAVEMGRTDMVATLVAREDTDVNATSSPDSGSVSPLHIAINLGREESFDLLLGSPKIKINLEDVDGITPLMHAASKQRERMFNILFARDDIDMNRVSKRGNNILMFIMHFSADNVGPVVHQMLLRVISAPQLNINQINTIDNEYSALIFLASGMARWVRDDAIDALLARNDLNVNLRVKNNVSALMRAAQYYPQLVQKILRVYGLHKRDTIKERVIDIDAENAYEQTAFDYGTAEVKKMILEYKGLNQIPLLPLEEAYLKADVKPNCEICHKKTPYPGFRHHCRRCMKFICSTCSRKIRNTIYCFHCEPLI